MPQLDINTFLFQYTSLITIFVIIYIMLTYIILPTTLRSLIIRSKVVENKNKNSAYLDSYSIFSKSVLMNVKYLSLLVNPSFASVAVSKNSKENSNFLSNAAGLDMSFNNYCALMLVISNSKKNSQI